MYQCHLGTSIALKNNDGNHLINKTESFPWSRQGLLECFFPLPCFLQGIGGVKYGRGKQQNKIAL